MKGILILVALLVAGSHTSFAQYWNLSNSNISNSNAGNVGIGTTIPPDSKLTIQSTTNGLNSGLLIKDAGLSPRGAIYFASTGQDFVIDALSAPGGGDVSTFKIRTGTFAKKVMIYAPLVMPKPTSSKTNIYPKYL